MWFKRKFLLGLALVALAVGARGASEAIYDEKADGHEQVASALAEAAKAGKNLVLIFGANW